MRRPSMVSRATPRRPAWLGLGRPTGWRRFGAGIIAAVVLGTTGAPAAALAVPSGALGQGPGATYRLVDTWSGRPWELVAGRYGAVADISSAMDGTVYVLDSRHGAVHILGPDGEPRRVFTLPDTGLVAERWWGPVRLDVGADGTLAVLLSGVPTRAFGVARVDLLSPDGVRWASYEYHPAGGSYNDVAAGPGGSFYLSRAPLGGIFAQEGTAAVDQYALDGDFITAIDDERLSFPTGVDVAADGTVYVLNQIPNPGGQPPPGPTPTPNPSVMGGARSYQAAPGPVEGVLIYDAGHRFVDAVAFGAPEDVAVGPAGVFVSRNVEIYRLGEGGPLFSGPTGRIVGGYFGRTVFHLDVPTDGRLWAGVAHCYFQGVALFDDPTARPADPRLVGALDGPELEGPVYPLRVAADAWLGVLEGRFDINGFRPDVRYEASLYGREIQTVQRWAPGGRLLSQLGLCSGYDAWWIRDIDVVGDTVFTVDPQIARSRAGDGFPTWRSWPGQLFLPDGASRLTAVAADQEGAAVLDAGNGAVVFLDPDGRPGSWWPFAGSLMTSPVDMTMAGGRVYLAEGGARRVTAFDRAGNEVATWDVHDAPVAIDAGPDASIFVLGRSGWGFRYSQDGELQAAWRLPAQQVRPLDIAVGSDGRVYVNYLSWERTDRSTYVILDAGVWVFEATPSNPPPGSDPRACLAVPDKTAAPGVVRLGNTVAVTLTVTGRCPGRREPLDLALVVDTSRSMNLDDAREHAVAAGLALLSGLDPASAQVTLVTYDEVAGVVEPLTSDLGLVARRLAALEAWGNSFLGGGLTQGTSELTGPRSRPGAKQAIVVLTDGMLHDDPRPAAATARGAGIGVHVLVFPTREFGQVDRQLLVTVAGDEAGLLIDPRGPDLDALAHTAWEPEDGLFEDISITDLIPSNMRYVPASARPSAREAPGSLVWTVTDVAAAEPLTLTYVLEPLEVGTWPTNVRADAVYTDALATAGALEFPEPMVKVWDPSSLAYKAYLPATMDAGCGVRTVPADVVLVMDTSISMADAASADPADGTKLDAARRAAEGFLALLAADDRAAVVTFNRTASIAQAFTSDRGALATALAAMSHSPGTRIDQGLAKAASALAQARPGPGRTVILLTDGRQNGDGDVVLAAAEALKSAGVRLFTIGLGGDVDSALLSAVASDAADYYPAPAAGDLAAIYAEVHRRLPCGP